MSDGVLMLMAVLAPMAAGLATCALPPMAALVRTLMALAGPLVSFLVLVGLAGRGEAATGGWSYLPELGIDFYFRGDALGLFFGLLVSGIGVLIVCYQHAYFRGDAAKIGRLLPLLGVFATAMIGVALSDSMLGLFVFWELTTVSSFLLIGWDRSSPGAVRSAVQAAVITGTGGLALLLGLVVLGTASGTWLFSEVEFSSLTGWQATLVVSMVAVAAGTKSAQFPLHGWLPGAMAAPTPVSAYLHSATMVKAGVFLLARVVVDFDGAQVWPLIFVPLGAFTMAYAAVQALRGDTIKRVLAFSTVSQLGLFVCLYGLGGIHPGVAPTLEWPIGQILNHAFYKAPLFMLAGAMAVHAGVKYVHELDGLAKRLPAVGWLFVIGLYAMAAGPLTFSFAAKEYFVVGAYHATEASWLGWLAIVCVVIAAACNAALLVRLGRRVLGSPVSGLGEVVPGSAWMWWPAALLLSVQVVGGVAPGVLEGLLRGVETDPLATLYSTFDVFGKPGLPLAVSLGALTLGVVLGLSPLLRRPGKEPCDHLFGVAHRLLEQSAFVLVNVFQTGSIRRYLFLAIATLGGGLVLVMVRDPAWFEAPSFVGLFEAPLEIVALAVSSAVFVCVASLALPPSRLRIVRILVLGAVGFGVTLLYLINRAPDLALTQIMFEIISIVMFLLVMRMLPEKTRADQEKVELPRAAFAGVIGVLVGWAVFHGATVQDRERLGELPERDRLGAFFLDHSHEPSALTGWRDGGGDNVVNVILVDFRGYDTLGEITVLGIALLAVLAMLGPRRLRPAGREERLRVPGVMYEPQVRLTSTMLRVGMRAIVPLAMLFAGYVFFKGHQEPGGGFIAGLIASVAMVLYRMTEGRMALRTLMPMNPALLVGVGLTIALATGAAPLVLDLIGQKALPFLTSGDMYLHLSSDVKYHLASVLFFDLGVFLVVIGASVGMINRLEEELE